MQTQNKKIHASRWRENRPRNRSKEAATTLKAWWLIRVRLFQIFSSCSVFASIFLVFLSLASSYPLSNGFLHFLRPCCRSYMQKKWSQDQQVVLASLWFLLSFPFFLFFLFYCQSSQPHSNTGEMKETFSILCVFLTYCLPPFRIFFLLSFFLFFLPFLSVFLGH